MTQRTYREKLQGKQHAISSVQPKKKGGLHSAGGSEIFHLRKNDKNIFTYIL